MIYQAKNDTVTVRGGDMDYIRFGTGERILIMIPGLGEGLQSIKGTAMAFALMYRKLAERYTVHVFSRRKVMPVDFTTRDIAEDIRYAMDALEIPKACVIGISLGGMIVQHLAIDHPERVEKLILCVTIPYKNDALVSSLTGWIHMARRGDFGELMEDTAEKSYTQERLKTMRSVYRASGALVREKYVPRFITMARAGIAHDASAGLHRITCPTLIIGGRQDKIVTGEASEVLHRLIPGSTLYMYEDYGHGLYEEAPDFIDRVIDFFGSY